MKTKPFKIILLSLLLALGTGSLFFISVEIINLINTNFFVFLHPFNGLVRYVSRLITFLYFLFSLNFSVVNIFKTTPIKTLISKITLSSCFLISFTFLAYLDFFVFLIFNIGFILCVGLTFFIYWFIPNRKI